MLLFPPFHYVAGNVAGRYGITDLDQLDNLYGAYSLKRVRAAYGSGALVRLRRTSDNAESDFSAGSDGWIDASAITTWAGGPATVVTVYDQSGNSRPFTQATAGNQPTLDLSGSHPRIQFTAASGQLLEGTSVLAAFARNQAAVSAVNVRIHDTIVGTSTALWVSDGASANNVRVRLQVANGNHNASVRPVDNGTVTQVTDGAADNTTWITHVGVWNVAAGSAIEQVNGAETTASPLASNFSDTDSLLVNWGARDAGAQFLDGKQTALFLFRDALTPSEMAGINAFCSDLKAA